MKRDFLYSLRFCVATAAFVGAVGLSAQNSLPMPGTGGGFHPNGGPGPAIYHPVPVYNPGPPPPPYWGSPWYSGWNYSPTIVVSPSVQTNFQNQGTIKVIACGYDATGVWRVLPLVVSYQYNGVQYDVNVLNAWNPWTDQWDTDVDVPAYNTDYQLRGNTYDFYTVLSTGTFYFNL